MAQYTIELKDIVRTRNIFNFNYPFYDEKKRKEFEQDFIRHFYFREIGTETIDKFCHYLEDKMLTVFPYYNKLLEASTIEYDILNNYRLTETMKRNVEREENNRGVSSTVGRTQNEQEATSNQKQVVDTVGNTTTIGSDEEEENGTTTTTATGSSNSNTTGSSTTETSSDTTTNGTNNKTVSNNNIKKFLDTPQGLTDLSNSKYLTNLEQNTSNGTEADTTNSTTTASGTSETDNTTNVEGSTTDNSTTNNEKSVNRDSTVNQDTTGKETTDNNIVSTVSDEQKHTEDNNIKSFSKGVTDESYTIERVGNIGVDTDSDGILKHIKLQKVLAEIKTMFFNECEDLFMLIY